MKLTAARVSALQPRATEFTEWDDALPGFGCRVHPTGRKVFMIRYRTEAGTQRKMNLGNAEVIPVDDARQQARDWLVQASKGEDPAKDRRDRRTGMTAQELRDKHMAHCKAHLKPSTLDVYTSWWKSMLPAIGPNTRIRDLGEADIITLHLKLAEGDRKVKANRCIALLSAALNYAERMKWRDKHTNPCGDIQRFKEVEKQRILKPDEIKRLLVALTAYGHNRKCWSAPWAIRLLMVSGLRRNEWCRSRWEWIDWDARTLELPDSKTGPRTIHLSGAVIDLLRLIRQLSNSEWIIPTWDSKRPLGGLGHHWKAIRVMAGIPDVRIHDLRHTVGSLGHRAGLSQKEIADLLGHRHMKTAARYIHTYDEGRQANADLVAAAVMGK